MYCFRCPVCGYTVDQGVRDPAPTCCYDQRPGFGHQFHDIVMIRDWRREGVGIGEGVRESRRYGRSQVRSAGQTDGDAGATPAPSTT